MYNTNESLYFRNFRQAQEWVLNNIPDSENPIDPEINPLRYVKDLEL